MCIFPNSQSRFIKMYFLKITGQKKNTTYNYRQKAGLINSRWRDESSGVSEPFICIKLALKVKDSGQLLIS